MLANATLCCQSNKAAAAPITMPIRGFLLSPVVPPSPVGLDCLVYQFAEAQTKLNIKNIFDAVRIFTH
jgi:hypothetical protein